ncbi:longitudinals lacking protein, isoforms F/I/K/T-like [Bemisia tabaci]
MSLQDEENSDELQTMIPHHLDLNSHCSSLASPQRRNRNSEDSKWECADCGKRYKYRRGLAMHRRLECGKEPMFHCPYCPQKCHQKGNMVIHIRKKHPNRIGDMSIIPMEAKQT